MAISYDLISEFAKITNDNKKENKETNTYGKIVMYGNVPYVKLDGSEIITPCTTMIAVEDGDRVAVQIKNHNAFITGGITNPAASTKQMSGVKEDVAKFNTVVTDKLVVSDIEAINGYFQQLTVVAGRYDDLTAATAKIDELKGRYASFDRISADDIKSMNAEIDNLKTMMINAKGITTKDLETVNAQIGNLTAYNASFGYLSAEELRAIKANIKHLNVNVFDAETGNIKFANIDFSNIKMAAIEHLFSESGIIKDITSETGKITGELVGVTIKGDLIEGNTVTADKLVILGEDGAYYKLNIDGLNNISTSQASKFEAVQNEPDNWETNYKDYYEIINNKYVHLTDEEVPEWSSNKYYKLTAVHGQGLDGTNIIAQTITADKITVSDLVAFGATIGGFHITDHSIYSGVKSSATNTTRGVFMNDNGEFAIGDSSNFLRYYYDETSNIYKLEISAGTIEMGGTGKTLDQTLEDIHTEINSGLDSLNGTLGSRIEDTEDRMDEMSDTINDKIDSTVADKIAQDKLNSFLSSEAWFRVSALDGAIQALTNSDDGTYQILEQKDGAWTFQLGTLFTDVKSAINDLTTTKDQLDGDLESALSKRIDQLDTDTKYIRMTTFNNQPAIILGMQDGYILLTTEPEDWNTNYKNYYILENDKYVSVTGDTAPIWAKDTYYRLSKSNFEVRITNTSMDFLENGNRVAYVNNGAFYNTVGIVREEIKIVNENKGFSWKTRPNGNLGLQWVEET